MVNYKISGVSGLPAFPVASAFVDKYMTKANATFVKVYLYGLRLCYAVGTKPDNAHIAKELDLLESDVVQAWNYWEGKGVIRRGPDGGIEFVDLTMETPAPPQVQEKPQYKAQDIAAAVTEDKKMAMLLNFAQNVFGKTLSTAETATLYSFYDWLKLPLEVIMMLLEHCAALEKYNMRYAEKIAIAWADEGINTIERAENHLQNADKRAKLSRKYKRMLGITGRDLSDSEYAHILQWTEEMQMPQELIKTAYEKAVLATGHASFPYINAILQSWHRQDITSIADLEKDAPPAPPVPKVQPKKTNKFLNYEQTAVYDFEEIERRALEKRIKEHG
ncbi:MAG: DnaD domain protein [Clostridia bacterium]|nr:DnaD domain protein [Clostridia bacterium]